MMPSCFLLLFTYCSLSLCVSSHFLGLSHYCWNGTDDLAARRNMSCETGKSSIGNMMSLKMYPTPKTIYPGRNMSSTGGHGYFCMVFEYYITSMSVHEDMYKTKEVLYTCDTQHICDDKEMGAGYEATYKGHSGNVFCCNSNNCNNKILSQAQEHMHTCIAGVQDKTRSSGEIRWCPTEKMPCLRTRKTTRSTDTEVEEFLEERYSCDVMNICASQNFSSVLLQACKVIWDESSGVETEVCCCKGDNCFLPDWFDVKHHQEGQSGKAQQRQDNSGWQRTLLICIGVALAFLAVFVSLCFIRRTRQIRRQQKMELSRLEYKVVQSEEGLNVEDESDSVHILPAEAR